ncbi:MAG TPA: glycosyltransferase [Candidatus Paceibacterota bacterium]|nr:glycosyltransferase [Candidatus Paceibacterota bacterium]
MIKKRIKILYVITGLGIGGAEMIVKNLCFGLDPKKFEVIILSILPVGDIGKTISKKGFSVYSLNVNLKFNIFLLFKLFNFIHSKKPDIVHGHLFHADFLSRLVCFFFPKIIYISTIHNIFLGGKNRNFLLKITSKIPSATIAVGDSVFNFIIQNKISNKNRTIVIYNGVDIKKKLDNKNFSVRKKLNIKKEEKIITVVARLDLQKGHNYMISAIKKLKSINFKTKTLFIGDGELKKKIIDKIDTENLNDEIKLIGKVNNVADYLSESDLFVLTSDWEGLPLSLIEAILSDVICVCFDVGGVSELIEDNVTGFLVEPKNIDMLSEKIKNALLISEDAKKEMTHLARTKAAEKFSLNKMISDHEKLYENFSPKQNFKRH